MKNKSPLRSKSKYVIIAKCSKALTDFFVQAYDYHRFVMTLRTDNPLECALMGELKYIPLGLVNGILKYAK